MPHKSLFIYLSCRLFFISRSKNIKIDFSDKFYRFLFFSQVVFNRLLPNKVRKLLVNAFIQPASQPTSQSALAFKLGVRTYVVSSCRPFLFYSNYK